MLEVTDIVLRTLAVGATLALAVVLIACRGKQRAALPGAFLALAVAAFVLTSVPGARELPGIFIWPLTALCVTKAAWFWLFARALFDDRAVFGPRHLAVIGILAGTGAWQQLVFLDRYRAGLTSVFENMAGFGFDLLLAGLVVLALKAAWSGMDADLVERRRRLRIGFLTATGAYLAGALALQAYNLAQGIATPRSVVLANVALIAVSAMLAMALLVRVRQRSWLDAATLPAPALSPAERRVLEALQQAIELDRVFLDEGLTVGGLAERVGTGEHVLRRVINRGLGYRNFNDFLHARRIEQACQELAEPEKARTPVLTIAMNVGYGSVGTFNRAFKARVGMTPTAFRRRHNGPGQAQHTH